MKTLKGTQTEKNLLISFAGESQARMRYTMFASKAKKEGFEQIAAIFLETAGKKKNMLKNSSVTSKVEWLKLLLLILLVK